jgi:hypothetical protein
MRTVEQLRAVDPNPWEVAWFVWSFKDSVHFYYMALKPNGWELGKADPSYPGAQRFLATGSSRFPIGVWHNLRVRQVGNVATIWANGERLIRYQDVERPYLKGRIGLYNEDASVQFRRVVVSTAG